jgi:hypothetical protein
MPDRFSVPKIQRPSLSISFLCIHFLKLDQIQEFCLLVGLPSVWIFSRSCSFIKLVLFECLTRSSFQEICLKIFPVAPTVSTHSNWSEKRFRDLATATFLKASSFLFWMLVLGWLWVGRSNEKHKFPESLWMIWQSLIFRKCKNQKYEISQPLSNRKEWLGHFENSHLPEWNNSIVSEETIILSFLEDFCAKQKK